MIIGIIFSSVAAAQNLVTLARILKSTSLTNSSPVNAMEGLSVWFETATKGSIAPSERVDGSQVTGWNDINQQSFRQQDGNSSDVPPTYNPKGINSLPTLHFDDHAGQKVIIDTNIRWENDFTIFVVASMDDFSNSTLHGLISNREGDDIESWWVFGTRKVGDRIFLDTVSDSDTIILDVVEKGPLIYVLTKTDTSFEFEILATKTFAGGSRVADITGISVGDSRNNLIIGKRTDPGLSGSWAGEIGEVIAINRKLADSEKEAIQEYLSQKWGISIL